MWAPGMDRNGNGLAGFSVYKRKMTALLTVFRKAGAFQGPYEFLGGNDWDFGAHQGRPIEISSTCTDFSA